MEPTPSGDFQANPVQSSKTSNVLIFTLAGCGCLLLGLLGLGIIAAIALPSFLTQADRAREAEAKNLVGAMVRAQQATYLETGAFATTVEELGIGVLPETENYRYELLSMPNLPTQAVGTIAIAQAKHSDISSYTGVALTEAGPDEFPVFVTGICKSDFPVDEPPLVQVSGATLPEEIPCPNGSTLLP
jgi:type II secretory pathway pseudopilin PulG